METSKELPCKEASPTSVRSNKEQGTEPSSKKSRYDPVRMMRPPVLACEGVDSIPKPPSTLCAARTSTRNMEKLKHLT